MQLCMPLAHMPERYMLRDSQDYDYEFYDDDDYFEEDDGQVGREMQSGSKEHILERMETAAG